jgi:SWI/SNF-related matrix-associated actin-dependent regulator of chromatin subfamily A member 5
MLRRVKAEVEKGLPSKLETTIECPLSEMQSFWYRRLLLRDSALLAQLEAEATGAAAASGSDWKKLASLMMQLRKVCNHPYMIDGADGSGALDEAAAASAAGGGLGAASSAAGGSAEPPSDAYSLEAIVGASGKLALLHRLLLRLHAGGHRAVLFSQFTSMLDLLQSYCAAAGWRVARLDGSTNRVQRTVDINAFNAPGSKIFLFLMSTRAGGLGINCQTADTCILYDSDWNPQPDLQAMARVHRIGQTKKVHVYRLVTHGTVEARILQRAEKKLLLDRIVNQDATDEAGAAPPSAADEPSGSDLLAALKFGAQCCFSGGEGRAPTDEELAAITDRARTADASLGALRGGVQRAADSFDPAAVSTRIRELHGVEYGAGKAARQELDIGLEWAKQKAAKRQHVSTTTTTHVVGVGLVSVKKVNNYTMDEGMCLERAAGGRPKPPPGGARQVAGRDYDHESQCLACWDGGDLICCDFCPASFHLGCIGVRCATQLPFSWSCPHHACMQCNRKATSVGGLLFRCQVCPGAWCEDHLLEQALVVGANDRFEALGFRHPKEGCYVLCSHACKTWALEQGLLGAHGTDDFATAAAILGATGVDTTHAAAAARKSAAERNDWLRVDTRDSRARLDKPVRAALDETLKLRPLPLGAAIPLSTSGLEGLAAGERFVLYDAVQAAAALARNGALAAAGGEEEAPPDALGSAFYASNAARKAASDAALRALASWEGVPLEAAAVGGAAKAGSSAQKAAGSAAKAKKLKKALAEQQETLASFFIEISRLLEGERGETLAVSEARAEGRGPRSRPRARARAPSRRGARASDCPPARPPALPSASPPCLAPWFHSGCHALSTSASSRTARAAPAA